VKSKGPLKKAKPKSVAGSGNVFADIGFKNPDEMALKADLVWYINRAISQRGLTQAEAAALIGVNQPKVSALQNARLTDFSVERLMRFLVALGQTIDITIRPAPEAGVRVLKAGASATALTP
jgi:predicted XRE-type DNA-binding protein